MLIQENASVLCAQGDIDRNKHKGETGTVTGFARFSRYHGREAMVRFQSGETAWFWVNDLTAI